MCIRDRNKTFGGLGFGNSGLSMNTSSNVLWCDLNLNGLNRTVQWSVSFAQFGSIAGCGVARKQSNQVNYTIGSSDSWILSSDGVFYEGGKERVLSGIRFGPGYIISIKYNPASRMLAFREPNTKPFELQIADVEILIPVVIASGNSKVFLAEDKPVFRGGFNKKKSKNKR
eukprot:TRINITY_DN8173_c0_g1_i1.p1 TRINITY_DN8173_c0_g1~~TRINITY_DN8173_c0_g1_i1.p1  ORF type:complete len:171 (+),score=13.04 TRINITY_DN8173_c0_g1_i1:63-575(+)